MSRVPVITIAIVIAAIMILLASYRAVSSNDPANTDETTESSSLFDNQKNQTTPTSPSTLRPQLDVKITDDPRPLEVQPLSQDETTARDLFGPAALQPRSSITESTNNQVSSTTAPLKLYANITGEALGIVLTGQAEAHATALGPEEYNPSLVVADYNELLSFLTTVSVPSAALSAHQSLLASLQIYRDELPKPLPGNAENLNAAGFSVFGALTQIHNLLERENITFTSSEPGQYFAILQNGILQDE